jgi:hypothetical protein
MTPSPRLPDVLARDTPRSGTAESAPTAAELNRITELALHRGARRITLGRGRSAPAIAAATAFTSRWQAAGRTVLDVVTWPEEAASWLRQAARFAATDPDLWIMAGTPTGWAQMTRRLLWSTPWQPGRTLAFAALGTSSAIALVGARNLQGLTGATPDGGTWTVSHGNIHLANTLDDAPPDRMATADEQRPLNVTWLADRRKQPRDCGSRRVEGSDGAHFDPTK